MEYIGIDINEASNRILKKNLLKFDNRVESTILTSNFDQGLSWVGANKHLPLFYFFLGITIGNFEPSERKAFLTDVYNNMKIDDMFLITFDLKKDPQLVQRAYFNENKIVQNFLMRNIVRLNDVSESTVNSEDFWSHVYYNPKNGIVEGHVISKKDQEIKIA